MSDKLLSGTKLEVAPGIFIGATNFSEFPIASGLPPGISRYGATTGEGGPSTLAIANDAQEGNYFSMSGQSNSKRWGFALDAFDDVPNLDLEVEVLMRIFVANETFARDQIGPSLNMKGTTQAGYNSHASNLRTGGAPFQTFLSLQPGGAQKIIANMQEAAQKNVWAWTRLRQVIDSAPLNPMDWFVKTWYGTLADEPVGWDGQKLGDTTHGNINPDALGWGITNNFGSDLPQRVAFMSFTSDVSTHATPVPEEILSTGDILPPTVTVTELQATWVRAETTEFEVIS